MQAIYEYASYKEFLNDKISSYPNGGRGISSKLSKYIGVSAVMVSQVLKGNRNFSRDKIYLASLYFDMDPLETEYLLHMFDMNQSKSLEHVNYLGRQMEKVKMKLVERENKCIPLPEPVSHAETGPWVASGFDKTLN